VKRGKPRLYPSYFPKPPTLVSVYQTLQAF
jgi:hypothetical protein